MRIFTFSIFILSLCFISVYAQNFEVTVEDTTKEGLPGEEIVMYGHIVNLTNDSLIIVITRLLNDLPANWTSSLCLDVCAAPWVDELIGTVPPADSLEFSIHFFTDTEPDQGQALLLFTEPRGVDSTKYLFTAITSDVAVALTKDTNNNSFRLLGNYPNPFNISTIIRFKSVDRMRQLKFQVFTVVGKLVHEKVIVDLSPGESQIVYSGTDLNGNNLPSGTYVYRLSLATENGQQFIGFGKLCLLK